MFKINKYIVIAVLVLLLVVIRAFESVLFYDPYLLFFKNDFLYLDSPRQELLKLVGFTTLRFVLNSLLSLGILYVFFKDSSILKVSAFLYAVAYAILIPVFLYFVINPKQEDYFFFFNCRRLLIQPVLLIILFPAFYYHRLQGDKS